MLHLGKAAGLCWISLLVAQCGRPDESGWEPVAVKTGIEGVPLRDIAFGGSRFVACGPLGSIFTSPDGETWTRRKTGVLENLERIFRKQNRFWVVGSQGSVLYSDDALEWRLSQEAYRLAYMPVVYALGKYVAVGDGGLVYSSEDGLKWNRKKTGPGRKLNAIAYGAGRFLAVGAGGTLFSSDDGMRWTQRDGGVKEDLSAVVFAAGQFKAIGAGGLILASPDGIRWTKERSGGSESLQGIAQGGGRFIAVGDGALLASRTDEAGATGNIADTGTARDALVGVWASRGMAEFLVGVWTGGDSLSFHQVENPGIVQNFPYPTLPDSAPTVAGFVPEDWRIEREESGDLDGDGAPDVVTVLRYNDTLPKSEAGGPAKMWPRMMAILLAKPGKAGYRLAKQSSGFLYDILPRDARDSAESLAGIRIENGVLTIAFSWFFDRYDERNDGKLSYRFRLGPEGFALIGSDRFEFSRYDSYPATETSCNFLTRKRKTTVYSDSTHADPSVAWSRIESYGTFLLGDAGSLTWRGDVVDPAEEE